MIHYKPKNCIGFLLALGLILPSFAFAQSPPGISEEEFNAQMQQIPDFNENPDLRKQLQNPKMPTPRDPRLPQQAASEDDQYWNLNKVDIRTLIQQVAELTGKNFVVDPRVQGKVTFISEKSLNKEDTYQAFLSTLQVHGYTAIDTDEVIKIVPDDLARTSGTRLVHDAKNTDEMVTKVFKLKFATPSDIYKTIKAMVSKAGHAAANDETNRLIISDNESNIDKLEKIIAQLDLSDAQTVEVIPVEHASAYEVADTLSKLLSKSSSAKKLNLELGFDERTNSLLIAGGSKESRQEIKKLVKKLDKSGENQYNSEVIYLKYADAADIAPIVASFLEEALRSSSEGLIRQKSTEGDRTSTQTTTISTPTTQGFSSHLRSLKSFSETAGSQGVLFGQNESQPKSGALNRYVQWEESTNALIVKAPPSVMRAVKNIIGKLDIRRPQVLIEVIIAEVNLNRTKEYGIEWDVSPIAAAKFGTRFPGTDTAAGIVGNFAGGTVAQLGTGLSLGIFRHGNLRSLLKMLASDSSANILSTPNLVTLDNQTALIKVGQKVPFAIGETNNQNVGGNPFTSFDREEVGLSLTIKPQITQSGAIKLEIENILSNVVAGTAAQNAGRNPITSERSILTNVMIDDGKILVLGGLIQDSWQEVKSRVPLLGYIPLVGQLFSSTNKTLVKQNLMVFIRPVILRDDAEGIRLSNNKYDHMRRSQKESYHVLDRPMVDEPVFVDPLKAEDYYPSSAQHNEQADYYPGVVLPHPFES